MLKAEAEGITPRELIGRIAAERPRYLEGFHIKFDNWHSTESVSYTHLDVYKRQDQTMSRMIAATLAELDKRMLSTSLTPSPSQLPPTLRPSQSATTAPTPSEAARTLLIADVGQAARQAEAARLDISTLHPGDIIEGRYKYIDKIGRGAFGLSLIHI